MQHTCTTWNPISNTTRPSIDEKKKGCPHFQVHFDEDPRISKYTSMKILLVDSLGKEEILISSNGCTAMDVWLGWLEISLELEAVFPKIVRLIHTGDSFLLIGVDYPRQTGHSELEHTKEGKPRHFIILTGNEQCKIWV